MLEKVNEILDFWFGSDRQNPLALSHQWWKSTPEFDLLIKSRFESLYYLAASGELDEWIEQPHCCLAYIILLDQFPRNMFRGTPLAYAQDARALHACEKGRAHKFDKELDLIQRQFFYMPLEHSEDINDQKLCLALMKQSEQEARMHYPHYLSALEEAFHFAQKHYDVILNFGRFPQRNAILGRESTQEELVFLSYEKNYF